MSCRCAAPGAGKTVLLEATIEALRGECRMAVIEGDLETENDARARFPLADEPGRRRSGRMPAGCDCARVVLGRICPDQCRLYGVACTPRGPVGPYMVSDEGRPHRVGGRRPQRGGAERPGARAGDGTGESVRAGREFRPWRSTAAVLAADARAFRLAGLEG